MDRLLEALEVVDTRGDLSAANVTSIEFDSRSIESGALFCCLSGRQADGHDFAGDALRRGAVGLLAERFLPFEVPQAVVGHGAARPAMATLSCRFFGDPARSMAMVGVTGTNGKTTVTQLLGAIFDANGQPCTVIGTLHGPRTTPEAPELQRLLAEARQQGRKAVAMEVSSHALSESRVDGIRFDATVFTNLSHDHLDYHGTMDDYFEAKALLFDAQRSTTGVVNADDSWGRRLIAAAGIPIIPFSMADATDIVPSTSGTEFTWRGRRVAMRLRGPFHVANALAAATTASVMGVDEETIVGGLKRAAPVAGRFEVLDTSGACQVVIDYAHTPDGLSAALAGARQLAGSCSVLCVFGCGGDRDQAKRPLMGKVAAIGADTVIVTSDNPRSEDPAAIIEAIMAGVVEKQRVLIEPDRRAAIELALSMAKAGDVVLIAGKGHEKVIEVSGHTIAFDDRQQAMAALRRLGSNP